MISCVGRNGADAISEHFLHNKLWEQVGAELYQAQQKLGIV